MKIAFIAAANSPHTIKWVNAMVEKGHDATVISLPDHKDELGEIAQQAEVKYLGLYLVQNGLKKNAAQLKGLIESGGYDVVNAIDAGTYGFLAARAKLQNILLTLTGEDIYIQALSGARGLVKKAIKNAAALCAPAANVQSQLLSYFKLEKKFFIAAPGVDVKTFKKKNHEHDGMCFATLKMLENGNGIDQALDAFAKFTQQYAGEAKLRIAGRGSMESTFKTQAQSMGIADKVEFTGYIPGRDIPDFLAQADILLQLSRVESFGVGAIEAMACEVPVIASDTVGASEYILNGVTGYLVKYGNTNACCERMLELSKNAEARARMGESARGDIKENYTLTKCSEKYEAALEAVRNS